MEPSAIKELRKKLKFTQEQLAAEIGVDRVTVNNWENGRTQPNNIAKRTLARLDGEA